MKKYVVALVYSNQYRSELITVLIEAASSDEAFGVAVRENDVKNLSLSLFSTMCVSDEEE